MALKYIKNVVSLSYDPDKCIGCAMCLAVCPHEVFDIHDEKAVVVDRDSCMECGACAVNCLTGAIVVEAGVGCAQAIIRGAIKGLEPDCC